MRGLRLISRLADILQNILRYVAADEGLADITFDRDPRGTINGDVFTRINGDLIIGLREKSINKLNSNLLKMDLGDNKLMTLDIRPLIMSSLSTNMINKRRDGLINGNLNVDRNKGILTSINRTRSRDVKINSKRLDLNLFAGGRSININIFLGSATDDLTRAKISAATGTLIKTNSSRRDLLILRKLNLNLLRGNIKNLAMNTELVRNLLDTNGANEDSSLRDINSLFGILGKLRATLSFARDHRINNVKEDDTNSGDAANPSNQTGDAERRCRIKPWNRSVVADSKGLREKRPQK